ncbi:MAG: Imm44 family immunity protein [Thermoflexibacter sp.]|jgi:hypothetical protein|nr:Imm44 family immunity protein [Thermoflexibacter sp.]
MRKSGLEPIRQFYITMIGGLYVTFEPSNTFLLQIENSLVENIDLKKYGDGLTEVNFIYLVRAAKDDKFGEYKRYSRLKKFVDFQLKIDEEDFIAASDENALGMMAELFLKSILLYKELKIKDFDDICFYNDVKKLFIEKKLMANTDKVEIN